MKENKEGFKKLIVQQRVRSLIFLVLLDLSIIPLVIIWNLASVFEFRLGKVARMMVVRPINVSYIADPSKNQPKSVSNPFFSK